MESLPQNPELSNNTENFQPYVLETVHYKSNKIINTPS